MVTLDLTINISPTVDLGNDVAICANDSTLLDAGTGHTNYLWNTGDTTQTIYADTAGTYSVTVGNAIATSNSNSSSFDGVDDRIIISSNNLPGGNSARSVSAWFYPESGFGNILAYGDGSQTNKRFSFLMNSGDVKFVGENNDHFGHTVSLNQWHFITITYANNKLKMYIDGAIADSVLLGTNLNTDNSYPLVIGSNTTTRNDEYFGGKVTQVSVWDRILTATDVQNHMNCPPSTNALGLLGYWELGNNANDATAYGNNGVIEGAIMSTEGPVFTCSNQSFCTATDDIVVTVNPLPTIDLGADTTLICAGTSITLDASSGNNYDVNVTAAGASDYILSGAFSGNDPPINISVGDVINFNVNSPGHPFFIKTTNTPGSAGAISVANNGTSSGTISWSPTTAGTYYYICEFHPGHARNYYSF